jgi:sigma-B regulation protein RsbU (phosphoserine phosphatase)
MLPGSAYEVRTEAMRPGDLLVLYTDGITESRNLEGEEYGLDRLVAFGRANTAQSAADLCAALLHDLGVFTGAVEPADDRTLVVVKRL